MIGIVLKLYREQTSTPQATCPFGCVRSEQKDQSLSLPIRPQVSKCAQIFTDEKTRKRGGKAKGEVEKQKKKEVKEGEAGDEATNLKLRTKKQQRLGRSAITSEQIFQRF